MLEQNILEVHNWVGWAVEEQLATGAYIEPPVDDDWIQPQYSGLFVPTWKPGFRSRAMVQHFGQAPTVLGFFIWKHQHTAFHQLVDTQEHLSPQGGVLQQPI